MSVRMSQRAAWTPESLAEFAPPPDVPGYSLSAPSLVQQSPTMLLNTPIPHHPLFLTEPSWQQSLGHTHLELALLQLQQTELTVHRADFRFNRRRAYNDHRIRVRVYNRMTTLNMSLGWRPALGRGGGWDARPGITETQKDIMEGLLASVGLA